MMFNPKKILVIGGAGFIGCNTVKYYLRKGVKVIVLDNFSRRGSKKNIMWLESIKGDLEVVKADIKYDQKVLDKLSDNVDAIIHLAAQVAVTTSIENPRDDFETNALGTLNVLEAIRRSDKKPPILYSSTNKVYGGMQNVKISERKGKYVYKDFPYGIDENFPLDFYSPYGCSKGVADQYVRDYARIYGLKTVVFRQSCIYGPRQFGIEDQGWVAWFIIAVLTKKQITIYGDGKQVRDLLYVDDLVLAIDKALRNIQKTSNEIFNIGGGCKNTMSVWKEFRVMLEKHFNVRIEVNYEMARPGDQKIFISDIRKAKKIFNWEPKVQVDEGVERLYQWAINNKSLFVD